MKIQRRYLNLFVLTIFILIVGMACGLGIDRVISSGTDPSPAQGSDASLNQGLIDEAWKVIQENYVDRPAIKSDSLTYGAISGIVSALGDTGHSRFLSPDQVTQEHIQTQGEFEGIGAEVEMRDGLVTIVAPFDGSPAQKAGLQPGDVIAKVDGVDVTGMGLNEVVSKVLGPSGSKVTLTILQAANGELRDVTITRAKITIINVTWTKVPGTTIAHLRVAQFSQGISGDVEKALQEIEAQHLTGIILDLRNDPGGILNEAVKVISLFQEDGDALQVKDAKGTITDIPVQKGMKATSLPVVVLINEGSASASEITAGALQDAGRATLVGATTFGTGTVMNEFKLSDGSVLLLATQEWLTPKGRVIWHKGIEPDQAAELPAGANLLIPAAEKNLTAEQVQSSGDAQLLKALKVLTGG